MPKHTRAKRAATILAREADIPYQQALELVRRNDAGEVEDLVFRAQWALENDRRYEKMVALHEREGWDRLLPPGPDGRNAVLLERVRLDALAPTVCIRTFVAAPFVSWDHYAAVDTAPIAHALGVPAVALTPIGAIDDSGIEVQGTVGREWNHPLQDEAEPGTFIAHPELPRGEGYFTIRGFRIWSPLEPIPPLDSPTADTWMREFAARAVAMPALRAAGLPATLQSVRLVEEAELLRVTAVGDRYLTSDELRAVEARLATALDYPTVTLRRASRRSTVVELLVGSGPAVEEPTQRGELAAAS